MVTPSPSLTVGRRPIPKLEDFAQCIMGDSPTGTSLRYDLLYDEVRRSRQEDDPRLSMGIWKTELKKADWAKIETLCTDALITKTKDLQISAWLTEAWIALDGIEGYIRGVQMTSDLCNTFWKDIFPLPQDNGDMENRYMILEWMDSTMANRLLFIPLTQSRLDQSAYGLGYFKSAQHGDAALRRVDQSRNVSTDPTKSVGTIEEFQKSMEQTPDNYLFRLQKDITRAIDSTQNFKNALAQLIGADAPSFIKVFGTLREMDRILKTVLQTRQPPSPEPAEEKSNLVEEVPTTEHIEIMPQEEISSNTEIEVIQSEEVPSAQEEQSQEPHSHENVEAETIIEKESTTTENTQSILTGLKTREDAYRELENIANFLDQTDPHSLAPQLIRQLIRWQNKHIIELLSEIAETPEEYKILMKILGNPKIEK